MNYLWFKITLLNLNFFSFVYSQSPPMLNSVFLYFLRRMTYFKVEKQANFITEKN